VPGQDPVLAEAQASCRLDCANFSVHPLPNTLTVAHPVARCRAKCLREGLTGMNERPAGTRGHGRPPLHAVPDLATPNHLRVHLGDRLRAVRKQCGLTQEKAAVAAGITRGRLAELEKARYPNPTLSTLLRLMRTYDLRSVEELLGPVPSARLAAAWDADGWDTPQEEVRQ
jgi:DNA-binding XRE family transcriptional regulator